MISTASNNLSPLVSETELADFQAAMLKHLSESDSAAEFLAKIKPEIKSAELISYLETFEPKMIEVAIELIKKWGNK